MRQKMQPVGAVFQLLAYGAGVTLAVDVIKKVLPGTDALLDAAVTHRWIVFESLGAVIGGSLALVGCWSFEIAMPGGQLGHFLDWIASHTLTAATYKDKVEQAIIDLKERPQTLHLEGQRWRAFVAALDMYWGVARC